MNLKGEIGTLDLYGPHGQLRGAHGSAVCVSSWRRTPDNAIPARAKCTGSYVNTALAVDEAHMAGYDDAIFLTQDGQVSEASAANIFLRRKGQLITPPVTADILEGITRDAVMELAEQGARDACHRARRWTARSSTPPTRSSSRGRGSRSRPWSRWTTVPIGTGSIGPVAERLQELYFKAARGEWEEYADWTVAVEVAERAAG